MMQTMPKPIDFAKVEALRRHMLLTSADMAELFGVSRITYYGWVKGKPIRRTREAYIRTILKKLLAIVADYGWPTPEVIAASREERKKKLLELLK